MMGSEGRATSYLIVDVDDVLTTAVLIDCGDGRYVLRGVGEAATTVEPPELDVTVGVRNAINKLEVSSGLRLLYGGEIERISKETTAGVDLLCSSSSGEGLHMMVAGLIRAISAESAQRAALGAGAFLMDLFSIDDGRQEYERVERMRSLRPDIFLLTGGTDGGNAKQVIEMAELIRTADVKPRFGAEFKLPVIYAGNIDIRKEVAEVLSEDLYALKKVENVRPVIEKENLGPAREAIYDAYMEHVIVHSPGYNKLIEWIQGSIIPTQAAIGEIIYSYAREKGANLIGVDLGGATTDVYSVFDGIFNRSLNADLGMSYGVCNIMKEAGVEKIVRWIPVEMGENEVRNIIGNMMIHLTEPRSPEELMVQHAVAREAIRLGMEHHRTIATRLKGISMKRTISDMFVQEMEETIIKNMMEIGIIVGKGRVLSSAPRMEQAALILLDSLQPEGITEVLLDRPDIMSHLGMLSKVNREAALEILKRDCMSNLGICIAPKGVVKEGEDVMRVLMRRSDGTEDEDRATFGELKTLPLKGGELAEVEILPARGFDVGMGSGKSLKTRITGGLLGLIIDARGRPMPPPEKIGEWAKTLKAYPDIIAGLSSGGN